MPLSQRIEQDPTQNPMITPVIPNEKMEKARMIVTLATENEHKLWEIGEALRDILPDARLESLRAYPGFYLPPEDGDTFTENALIKARSVFQHTGKISLADDSGLEVDALGGRPGVHSKRFSDAGTDSANNALLLEYLHDVENRRARFRCVLALVGPGFEATVDGTCEGTIGHSLRGSHGFGYDPLFHPNELNGRTLAEAEPWEKLRVGHRGAALRQLPALFQRLIQSG